nr:retrovirus-related Pol polyprotein from transposon TNT 1-94 [Tanacetum cinerariifolium]
MDSIIPLGQKNTLAEYMILSGADNRPPMLDKDLYDFWKSRMKLYMQNKKHRRMILESIEQEKFQVNTKFLNSLSPKWSKFVTDVKLVKYLHTTNFDQIHAYLVHHQLHANEVRLLHERNQDPLAFMANQQMTPPHFRDDPIACLNKAMAFLTDVASLRFPSTNNQFRTLLNPRNHATIQDAKVTMQQVQGRQGQSYSGTGIRPKRPRNAAWYKKKAMLAEAQEAGQILDEDQLAFLADPGVPNGQAKANKEQNNESVTAELERYKERVKTFEQRLNIDLSSCKKMIDSQMDDMIKEKIALKEQVDSLEQNLSKQIKEKECLLQTFTVFKNKSKEKEDKYMENEIDLEMKIKEIDNILFKVGQSAQLVHVLTKPQVFYDNIHKQALGYQNPFHLKKVQRTKPTLYDGIVISDKHIVMHVIDDEETLILEEKSRSRILTEDFGKHYNPQQELSVEQAFLLRMFDHTSKPFDTLPIKIEALKELPKISLVNESLKKLKFHLAKFDNVVKIRTTPNARTKAQLQDKDNTICKLKDIIKSLREKSKEENVNYDYGDIETKNAELENGVAKLILENERLCNEINHVKQVFKEQFDSIKKTRVRTNEQSDSIIDKLNLKTTKNENLKAQLQDKVFVITSLKNDLQRIKRKEIVDIAAQKPSANTIVPGMFKLDLEPLAPKLLQNREAYIDYFNMHAQRIQELLVYIRDTCPNAINLSAKKVVVTPKNKVKKVRFAESLTSSSNNKQVLQIVLWNLESRCSKHMTGNHAQLINFVSKFLGIVRLRNDHIARIMGYGDYQLRNVTISRVYYVEGLGHNLFSIGKFCDTDLEVAFRKNTCFLHDLEGVDLISGSRDTNLYIISLDDMLKTSSIHLLLKASKTNSWLWHRRLSHLNFGTLNKLAKDGLARGIPRHKFQKDHLCSACALGKSKKSSHPPIAKDTNQEKLYLLHMDLCGPMRVASINGKMYILVIVDDYLIFTWVRFLRSKDEAPEAII